MRTIKPVYRQTSRISSRPCVGLSIACLIKRVRTIIFVALFHYLLKEICNLLNRRIHIYFCIIYIFLFFLYIINTVMYFELSNNDMESSKRLFCSKMRNTRGVLIKRGIFNFVSQNGVVSKKFKLSEARGCQYIPCSTLDVLTWFQCAWVNSCSLREPKVTFIQCADNISSGSLASDDYVMDRSTTNRLVPLMSRE